MFLFSRLRFLPASGLDETSVSSEELAVASSEDVAVIQLVMGRSNSRSTEGESSEEEVGGVNRAEVML